MRTQHLTELSDLTRGDAELVYKISLTNIMVQVASPAYSILWGAGVRNTQAACTAQSSAELQNQFSGLQPEPF